MITTPGKPPARPDRSTVRRGAVAPRIAACCLVAAAAGAAHAQNLGGVFSPVVRAGTSAIQYRASLDPETSALAQRVHVQRAFGDRRMWRLAASVRTTGASDVDLDQLRAELFWQLSPAGRAHQHGVRFDLVLRDDRRPQSLGLNWSHNYAISPDWSVRGILLTSLDFGENRSDGLGLQTRGQLVRKLSGARRAGLELYSAYGRTAGLARLREQRHQAGPFLVQPLDPAWSVRLDGLFGLTPASPGAEVRLRLTRSL